MLRQFLLFLAVSTICAVIPPYSIGIASKTGQDQFASIQIVVNGVNMFRRSMDVEVPSSGVIWTDFPATPGDLIEVRFTSVDTKFDLYYLINNGPGGRRADIYDSRNSTLIPRNRCPDTNCTFRISNFLSETWGDSKADVFVNELKVISGFDGNSVVPFTADKNDEISVNFTFGGPSSNIGYSIQKLDDPIDYIEWYYDSYGSSAIIPNPYADVSFVLPEDNLIIPAGEEIGIQLISEPQQGNFSVELQCGNLPMIIGMFRSNTSEMQKLMISADYFGENCTLSVEKPIYGLNTRTLTVTQPVIISTVNSVESFAFNSKIPILISSKAVSDTKVTLKQVCGGEIVVYESVPVGEVFEAVPAKDFVGVCSFSSTAAGPFQASTNDFTVNLTKVTVEIEFPNGETRVPAGSNFEIKLISSSIDLNYTVQLKCGVEMIKTETFESGKNWSYGIPTNFYGDLCEFNVLVSPDLFIANTVVIAITHELRLSLSDNFIIKPNTLNLLVETPLFKTIKEAIKVNLTCKNNETEFEITTNEYDKLVYSDWDYGNCSVRVSKAPDYLISPLIPSDLALKIQLGIGHVFPIIFNGMEFDILIWAVTKLVQGISTIDLKLVCDDEVMQAWENVDLNIKIKLKMLNSISEQRQCEFRTPEQSDIFISAIKPVVIVPLKGPFGGDLSIIDENDCFGEFCKCLHGHFWAEKTFNHNSD